MTDADLLLPQDLLHRFALRQFIDQFVEIADLPHGWLLNVLYADAANHPFD